LQVGRLGTQSFLVACESQDNMVHDIWVDGMAVSYRKRKKRNKCKAASRYGKL
jgi:hypothetical protein